jgi:hypothetical protein
MSCDQVVQIISKMCTIATCVVFVNLVFILEEVAWIKYMFCFKEFTQIVLWKHVNSPF